MRSNIERRSRQQVEVKNQIDTTDKKDKAEPIDPDRERLKDFFNTVASELKRERIPYKDGGERKIPSGCS